MAVGLAAVVMVAAREVGSAVGSAAAVRVAVGTCAHHEKSSEKGLCMLHGHAHGLVREGLEHVVRVRLLRELTEDDGESANATNQEHTY